MILVKTEKVRTQKVSRFDVKAFKLLDQELIFNHAEKLGGANGLEQNFFCGNIDQNARLIHPCLEFAKANFF